MGRTELQGILHMMKDGIYIVNPPYEILYCNSALVTVFGSVNGRKCYQYLRARRRPCPWCKNEKVFAGETVRHEWVSDKVGKAYELVGTLIQNTDGYFSKLHILYDITHRERAKKALRVSAAQLRSLSTQLLKAQETERRRVSRELHDELGQALGTLKLRVSLIRNQLHEGQHEARADCDDTLHYMDQVIENVRQLARDLSPTILEDLGLETALRRLVSQFSRLSKAVVVWRIEDIGRLRSKHGEIFLYRVFQEALNNVQKHAHARNVSVILERRDHEIHCLVEDDGVGFDQARIVETDPAEKGMGLAIMAERVHILGGSLDLKSQPGEGTCISFSLPMRDARTR